MSQKLDALTRPFRTQQKLADRVAETLNLYHDFPPIQPTKKKIEYNRANKEYKEDSERDITMLTNIDGTMVFLSAIAKSMDISDPCEARTAFMEQIMRSSRSNKGWWSGQTIEAMKAVRPVGEEEKAKGRLRRFADWIKG